MFACAFCRQAKPDTQECDVRIEFRLLRDWSRQNVVGLGHLCSECARRVAGAIRDQQSRLGLWSEILNRAEESPAVTTVQTSLL